ncbi:hypothetical protein LCGC14_2212890 [marine sediment metagenome]|uniref:Uncharacterized protein n=1 Tax=marine sediment metagenome TaxID=412755 RepID=A0A0F9DD56_9ZZZZ
MSEQVKIEREYWSNGKLKYEVPYHQGQRHGVVKWWYKSGQLECENYFLYDEPVTKEEYRKHELIESLACLNK